MEQQWQRKVGTMKTIYETIGAAKEYCDYAVDIYEFCPHKCSYCYVKDKAEKCGKEFSFGGVRTNVLSETRSYLTRHKELNGKMVFLGFSSDAFPVGEDITATIEMIKLLMNNPIIFDGRNLYDDVELKKIGFEHYGIG